MQKMRVHLQRGAVSSQGFAQRHDFGGVLLKKGAIWLVLELVATLLWLPRKAGSKSSHLGNSANISSMVGFGSEFLLALNENLRRLILY